MAKYQSTHTGAEIDAGIDLLNSNSATSGQVLTANGTGGASWQDVDDGFVPKTTQTWKVYITDGSGNQTVIPYASQPYSNTIAHRDKNGRIQVADPAGQNDAVTKSYADNRFRYTHLIKITYVDGDFVAVTGIITYASNSSTPLTSFNELPPEVELPFNGRYSYMDGYSVENVDGNILRIRYFDYQQGESINVSWADMSELTTFTDTVL